MNSALVDAPVAVSLRETVVELAARLTGPEVDLGLVGIPKAADVAAYVKAACQLLATQHAEAREIGLVLVLHPLLGAATTSGNMYPHLRLSLADGDVPAAMQSAVAHHQMVINGAARRAVGFDLRAWQMLSGQLQPDGAFTFALPVAASPSVPEVGDTQSTPAPRAATGPVLCTLQISDAEATTVAAALNAYADAAMGEPDQRTTDIDLLATGDASGGPADSLDDHGAELLAARFGGEGAVPLTRVECQTILAALWFHEKQAQQLDDVDLPPDLALAGAPGLLFVRMAPQLGLTGELATRAMLGFVYDTDAAGIATPLPPEARDDAPVARPPRP